MDKKQLNEEQAKAVLHKNGPLLIVAGAGTGKTTAITQRLVYLIEQKLADSNEILAVTFTEKAAEEMEERVDRLLPFGYLDLWVSTFHSFCERILKEHALDIGISNDFKIVDETAAWILIKENFDKFNLDYYRPLGSPTKFIHALIQHFSRCKDEIIYPKDYLEYADKLKRNFDSGVFTSKAIKNEEKSKEQEAEVEIKRINELADAYHTYQKLLLDNNTLDFGDLINYCLKLFEKRPAILKQYQNQFKYILVDEFQDTNYAQYELVRLLAQPTNNLTVCADDDQSIYRFRGASISNVLQFKKDFPETKEIILKQNYRSTQNILDLSYDFIQLNNPDRLEHQGAFTKKLYSSKEKQGTIQCLHFKNAEEETSGVAKKILELMNADKEANFSDFAVLCRTNEIAKNFAKEFEREKLPYDFLASYGLYSQPVILDIISYLKMLDNYHESASLNRILAGSFLNISWSDLAKINQYSNKKAQSTYESLNEANIIKGLSKDALKKINQLLGWIKTHTKLAREQNVYPVALAFLNDTGYLKNLVKQERERDIELITQFFDKIKQFEESHLEPTVPNFIALLDMEIESGETGSLDFDIEKGPDAVKIMTIHAAKGLEFKYVFVPNLVDKRFPTIERKEAIEIPKPLIKETLPSGDIHLQEERRLFYVAMTRAKQGLFFSLAENYGGKRKKRPSRFLKELDSKFLNKKEIKPKKQIKQTKEQTAALKKLSLPKHFSYSQFIAFDNCPLQYKFAHILKVPRKGNAFLSFGKTIHNTLYQYLIKQETNSKSQENLFQEKQQKTFDQKEELKILKELYKNNWIDEWYNSQKEKKEFYKLGEKILDNFLKDYAKNETKIKTIEARPGLELDFRLKLGEDILKGKIDRVDEWPDKTLELIDYKTGKTKNKLSKKDKDQLLIYQMAVKEIAGQVPEKLTYYYLRNNKKLSFSSTEKEREEIKDKIREKIKKIKESQFLATPGWQCKSCDFKHICEFRKL